MPKKVKILKFEQLLKHILRVFHSRVLHSEKLVKAYGHLIHATGIVIKTHLNQTVLISVTVA